MIDQFATPIREWFIFSSSGDAALDEAAVAMVRRDSPVPAPPPELRGRVSLAVPVGFH